MRRHARLTSVGGFPAIEYPDGRIRPYVQGAAVGTGAATMQNTPSVPFVTDPATFFAMTSKNVDTPRSQAIPGEGGFVNVQLPANGVLSKIMVHFVGEAVVTTAAATTSNRWPYGLIEAFQLSVNGQNDLWNCDGLDLHDLRFIRYPSYDELVDDYPGSVGGGDSLGIATHPLHLTWEIPIAMDDTSLIGSLYAQSSATSISARLQQALNSRLFSANPGNVAVSGTFYVTTTWFDVPVGDNSELVLPDLSVLHGFNAVDYPFAATGEARTELVRNAGQLSRLLIAAEASGTNRLSALPSAASTKKIDKLRVEYGGNRHPYSFDPASSLLSINNQHYGAPVPYDRLVLDFVKENPARDRVLLQGVTEFAVVPTIGSGVTVSDGKVRVVQETLY